LSNQWGRDGGGSSGSRSGSGGIIIATIVSLLIGGAAGYGIFRTLDVSSSADLVAEHERTVAQLRSDLERATSSSSKEAGELARLTEDNASLRRQIESLRTSIDKSESALQAENLRFKQETIPALQDQNLELAERIADLEYRQNGPARQSEDGEKRIVTLTDQLNKAKKALEAERAKAGDASNAAVERLERDLAALRKERDALSADKVALERSQSRLQADVAALRKQQDTLAQKNTALERDVTRLNADLRTSRTNLDRQTARNRELTAEIRKLEGDLRDRRPDRADDSGLTPPPEDDKPVVDKRSPRNASTVQRAIRATPGLTRLSPGEKATLERELTAGECVTKALGNVFDRVPVLALRNLMRDLDSDC